MRAATRRALWVAGGVLAGLVLLVGAFAATLAAQLSGGWDEVFDVSHPQEGDPDVVGARAEGRARVDAEIVRLTNLVAVPALPGARVAQPAAIGEAAVDEPALGSRCERGQHNWKIDDPYDLACVEVRYELLAAPAGDVSATLAALDRALQADGWQPDGSGGLATTREYWHRFGPAAGPAAGPSTGPPGPGANPTPYRPADLPSAGYRSPEGTYQLGVRFDGFDLFTGQLPPPLRDGEFGVMLQLSTQSFSA